MTDPDKAAKIPVPMLPLDDPLVIAISHVFEVWDLDDIEDQDGDMLRGLARLAAHTVRTVLPGVIENAAPAAPPVLLSTGALTQQAERSGYFQAAAIVRGTNG